MDCTDTIKPLPLPQALLCFGIPAGLGIVGMYAIVPALDRAGVPMLWNFTVVVYGMFPLLLAAALLAYRLEGRRLSLAELRDRFRLHRLGRREWLWTTGLLVVYVGGNIALSSTAKALATALPLPLPKVLPAAVDPRVAQTAIPTEYLGVPLRGNAGVLALVLVTLLLNILGEELWWRGVILPRQELVHGRATWLVHGILWTLFHLPFWWNLVALLPSTLSLSFVVSRLKNTTPGIIAHSVLNGLAVVMLLLGVLGVGA